MEKLQPGEAGLRRKFYEYRRRSKRRKIEWTLCREEFKAMVLQPCHYCGQPPSQSLCKSERIRLRRGDIIIPTSGIDRVDPKVGYTWVNCVPCCTECNFMKHTASLKDFLERVKKIYDKHVNGSGDPLED